MVDKNPAKTKITAKIVDLTANRQSVESATEPTNEKPPVQDKVDSPKLKGQAQDKVVVNDNTDNESVKTIGPIQPRVTRSRKSGNGKGETCKKYL